MVEFRNIPTSPQGSWNNGAMSSVERYAAAKHSAERVTPSHTFDVTGKSGDFLEAQPISKGLYEVNVPYWLMRQTKEEALRVLLVPREEAQRIAALDSTFRAMGYQKYMRDLFHLVNVTGQEDQLGIIQEASEWCFLVGEDYSPFQSVPESFSITRDLKSLNTQLNQDAEALYQKLQQDGISMGLEFINVGARLNPVLNLWEKRIFIDVVNTRHGHLVFAAHTQDTSRKLPSIEPLGRFWDMIDTAAPL